MSTRPIWFASARVFLALRLPAVIQLDVSPGDNKIVKVPREQAEYVELNCQGDEYPYLIRLSNIRKHFSLMRWCNFSLNLGHSGSMTRVTGLSLERR